MRQLLPLFALLFTIFLALPVAAQPPTSPPESAPAPSEKEIPAASPCGGGAVHDDGTVETGYGFVPSSDDGIYVQELRSSDLPGRHLSKVCVCLLKTRLDDDALFRVVFYKDAGGRPADKPYAAVASRAENIPRKVEEAGRFYEVDVSGVEIPEGTSYVGVRWNPSKAKFLFTCTDTSEETAKKPVFFRETMKPIWTSVFHAKDPIFKPHRAILVRTEAGKESRKAVPGLKTFKPGTASQPPVPKSSP